MIVPYTSESVEREMKPNYFILERKNKKVGTRVMS